MKKSILHTLQLITLVGLLFQTGVHAQNISENFDEGMSAYNQNLYADAHEIFKKIIEEYGIKDELYAAARFYSASSLLKIGKPDEAASEFEFIVNNITWSKFREESLFTLGLIYYNSRRFALSRKNHLMLIYQYPSSEYSGLAMYWIGESYAAEGKLDEAIEFLTQAIEGKTNKKYSDYALYSLANVYEKTKDYSNAVKYYDQLLTFHSTSPLAVQAQVRIGVCYFYLKDYHNSILELSNPDLNQLPEDNLAEALYTLANSHYRVEEYNDAARVYSEVIEKFPGFKIFRNAQYGLAWSQFQLSNYNDAFNTFNYLSEGNDSIAVQSFIWKGESKRYDGKYNEALEIFQEFLNRYPTDPSVPKVESLIGLVHFDQNNYDLSLKYLVNATSSEDAITRAKAFTMIGEIELKKKNFVKARGNFEPAIKISSVDNDVHLRALIGLGISLFYLNETENAAEYFNQAETLDPTYETNTLNFYTGECYFKSGKYQEALSRYNAVKSEDKNLIKQIIYSKGYCYFNLGKYDDAANQFSEFVDSYPNDSRTTDARLRLADSYFGSKNFAAASKIFKQIFQSGKFTSDDPYTYYQYAQALYKSGETNSAIAELRNLQSKFPDSKYGENSLYTIGFIKFQDGDYRGAVGEYRNVLQIYQRSSLAPVVYYSIGDAYFNMGMYDSAIVNYRKVMTDYPSSDYVFDAVNGIQYSYVNSGKPESAVDLIDRFVNQNPNLKFSDQIFFKKGEIYYSQRDYQNAKNSYQEFLVKFPKSALVSEAYYWLGKSSQNLKEDDEAILYFTKVFENYPSSESAAVSVIELGKMYEAKGDFQSSINLLEKASSKLKDSPRLPEVLFLKGTAYIKADKIQDAYRTFEELAAYNPEDLFADKAKFEMGLIDLAASRYEQAENRFLEVAQKRTDELGARSQYYYGLSLFESGKTTEAISALVRVRTVFSLYDEWLSKSYMLLGDCYVKMNDKRTAEEMYRTVVSRHKSDQLGEEARQKINKLK